MKQNVYIPYKEEIEDSKAFKKETNDPRIPSTAIGNIPGPAFPNA